MLLVGLVAGACSSDNESGDGTNGGDGGDAGASSARGGAGVDGTGGETIGNGGATGGRDAGGAMTGGQATGGRQTGGRQTGGRESGGTEAGGTGGRTTGSGGAGGSTGGRDFGNDPLLAFPGARGFGARVTGGRGGRVIKVTNLNASGPGSLQEALDQDEPRIIVFEVSGVIDAGMIVVSYGDVTIAGQSAPGAGITIAGQFFAEYDESVGNIIVRHLKVRPTYDGSDGEQFDAIQFSRNHHFILDHVSVSGGVDETVDVYSAQDATIQWSTIESSGMSGHPEGAHNYGLINGPEGVRFSVLNNLFAHHQNRCPAIANGPAEVINNVVYNVRHGFVHHNPASGPFNLVGNTFVAGDDDSLFPFYFDDENSSAASDLSYFVNDNWVVGTNSQCPEGELTDPWGTCDFDLYRDASFRSSTIHDFEGVGDAYHAPDIASAEAGYDAVLGEAGALPRDVIAWRSVDETEARTGEWGARMPADLMEGLTAGTYPTDDDDDGMADAWEQEHGLDPSDGSDHVTEMESGYTAIEEYLNELAAALQP